MTETMLKLLGALVLAPLAGGLICGIDRKLTARMQRRIGPPVLQPFYDVIKLMRKEPIVVNQVQIACAIVHLAFMALAVMLLALGQDSVMFLFILAFSSLALILGGMSARSPYSRIGSQREIFLMMAYEPILILMVVGFYLVAGSFQVQSVLTAPRPLLFSLPLMFVAYLAVVAIKLQKSPFDVATSHHAHQEIVKGITIEFSGPYLGLIEIAHFYETALFIGAAGLFWATNLWAACGLMAAALLGAIVLDNLLARLTTLWIFKFMWTVVLALALVNIIWLYMYRGP